jgi:hypothetical protein
MTKLYLLPLLLFALPAAAQSLTPQVISSASSYFSGTTGSLSFTIGETAVESYTSVAGSLTQGFQPTIGAGNPLPLDFLSFTAKLFNNHTRLEWVTTHEIDTDHFEVQRSTDGASFNPIAEVPAANPANPGETNSYQATDSLPLPGTDYYRIKEVDHNGHATYSPIAFVKIGAGLSCMVYPNPAVDQLHILITCNSASQATIVVYDLRGQLVTSKPIQLNPGQNQFDLNIADKSKGMYLIKILGIDGLPSYSILKK